MLQLHVENAVPVRHKVWKVVQWSAFSPLRSVLVALTSFFFSLEVVDEICLASCRRCLPDTRTANLPTSHCGVGMPLSRCSVDYIRKTPTCSVTNFPATSDVTHTADILVDTRWRMGGPIQHRRGASRT